MDHLSGPELAVLTCFTGGPYESVQLRVYLHMYIYIYIYILVGGFNPSEEYYIISWDYYSQ